jgi:hypothetical protein
MKAYKHLIDFALDTKHSVSVWDGEAWAVKRSTDYNEIITAIESVEEAQIRIRDALDNVTMRGWAQIIPFGLEDDESVADHSVNEFFDDWAKAYELTV